MSDEPAETHTAAASPDDPVTPSSHPDPPAEAVTPDDRTAVDTDLDSDLAPDASASHETADTDTADTADATRAPDGEGPPLDLERVERDLAGVEAALDRLDDGTYWADEVTGEPIPDEVLAADPVARRAS